MIAIFQNVRIFLKTVCSILLGRLKFRFFAVLINKIESSFKLSVIMEFRIRLTLKIQEGYQTLLLKY